MERALVLASSPAGLRAAAWLAARGVAVRTLVLSGADVEPRLRVAAHRCLGRVWPSPTETSWSRAVRFRGEVVPLPSSRRDLVRLSGDWAAVGSAIWGRIRHGDPRDFGSWCERYFGGRLTWGLLAAYARRRVDHPDVLGVEVARHLFARPVLQPYCPSGPVLDWQMARIRDAGGDVIEDVEVLELEVEDGRVVTVETDIGREWTGDALLADVPLDTLARWIGRTVPLRWSRQWRIGTSGTQPADVVHQLDDVPPWVLVGRTEPEAWFTAARGNPVPEDGLIRAMERTLGRTVSTVRETAPMPVPGPTTRARVLPVIASLADVGVWPVGPLGLARPVSLEEELDWLELISAEGQTGQSWPDADPDRPWLLIGD